MDVYERHQRIWRLLYALTHRWICRKFNLSHEDLHVDGPVLLIPNHVNAWDPLLVAMSLKEKQVYYVASEPVCAICAPGIRSVSLPRASSAGTG